ncbi:MCIN protein, partial [Rhinopomastus cyanomelas]|nr:MCIN protein [Rhinopomastus cyanomelas]
GSMERGGRRRAFGSSICPNSVQCTPAHLAKKAARHVGCTARPLPTVPRPRAPLPRLRRNSTPPVRAAPIYALDPAHTFPSLLQGRCFQDGPELNFQEFRDAGDNTPTLMPPSLDCDDFDFSLGEEVAFSPCISQLESSTLAQIPLQRLPSPELCWRDLAGQHQKALGDTLEANSQLQETVMQRQEELVMPKGCNVQLKELASQARQLAEVLDTLMLPQCADGAALSPSPHPPPAVAAPAGISSGPERRKEAAGVDAMLRDVSEKCRAALQSLGASPETKARTPTLHGAFRGLSNLRAEQRPVGGGVAGGDSLRVALGQAGGIRTLTFPQGSAFTMRTDGGGYRLLWVPR